MVARSMTQFSDQPFCPFTDEVRYFVPAQWSVKPEPRVP